MPKRQKLDDLNESCPMLQDVPRLMEALRHAVPSKISVSDHSHDTNDAGVYIGNVVRVMGIYLDKKDRHLYCDQNGVFWESCSDNHEYVRKTKRAHQHGYEIGWLGHDNVWMLIGHTSSIDLVAFLVRALVLVIYEYRKGDLPSVRNEALTWTGLPDGLEEDGEC
jgi:hypothetical protein